MASTVEAGKHVAGGSFDLFLGNTLSTIILAVGSIVVARLLGPSDYGLISLSLVFPSLLVSLVDFGVSSALIRYPAQDRELAWRFAAIGTIFKVFVGAASALALALSADFIATDVFGRPYISELIVVTSIYAFGISLFQVGTQLLIGMGMLGKNAALTIFQAVVKACSSITLVVVGFGVWGAMVGHSSSFLIVGISGLVVALRLTWGMRGSLESKFAEALKKMFSFGIPLYLGRVVGTVVFQYQNFLLGLFSLDEEIGNFRAASNFAVLPALILAPLSTALFHAFSKSSNPRSRKAMIQYSVKYSTLLVAPVAVATASLSGPLVELIYGEGYTLAPLYVVLNMMSYLYVALGSVVVGNYFSGLGDTKRNLHIALVTAAVTALSGWALAARLGVVGVILAALLGGLVGQLYAVRLLRRHYGVSVDLRQMLKVLAPALFAGLLTYALVLFLPANYLVRLMAGSISFIAIWSIAAPLLQAIGRKDIRNLQTLTKDLKLLGKPLSILLGLEEMIVVKIGRGKSIDRSIDSASHAGEI